MNHLDKKDRFRNSRGSFGENRTNPPAETEASDSIERPTGNEVFSVKKLESRRAKTDISENSKKDHTIPRRFTPSEIASQLDKDFKYMRSKKYTMVYPFTIIEDEYPFKKRSSDSDAIIEGKNVNHGSVVLFGRLPKWKSTEWIYSGGSEDMRKTRNVQGRCIYLKKGRYRVWEEGEWVIKKFGRQLGLIIDTKHKIRKLKKFDLFDLFDPLIAELHSTKPFVQFTGKLPDRILEEHEID